MFRLMFSVDVDLLSILLKGLSERVHQAPRDIVDAAFIILREIKAVSPSLATENSRAGCC